MIILGLFKGWKVRKIIASLAKEIQEYVNCEDECVKLRLKNQIMVLYDNVLKNDLWLSKNLYRLERL